jgi:predicted alpha-1,6-mannanase (GH76 family)
LLAIRLYRKLNQVLSEVKEEIIASGALSVDSSEAKENLWASHRKLEDIMIRDPGDSAISASAIKTATMAIAFKVLWDIECQKTDLN